MHIYSREFYEDQQSGSYISAKEIMPIVLNLIHPESIIDVGCGVGTWLNVCQELGVEDILGLDGPYVSEKMLRIPTTKFKKVDLSQPLDISRKFDLAMSLEVAEHLSEPDAETFVESLVKLSPVVLFSAAIPLQGGHNHINEQWQSYWADKFFKKGYILVDCIRPAVWHKNKVEWWYAQNMLLFIQKEALDKGKDIQILATKTIDCGLPLNLVHPKNYERFSDASRASLLSVMLSFPQRLRSAISGKGF